MVEKGSVAVDGVSLTLVDVEPGGFSVALIPHTLAHTTLGWKKARRSGEPGNGPAGEVRPEMPVREERFHRGERGERGENTIKGRKSLAADFWRQP